MANTCKTCKHPDRAAIDKLILKRVPYLTIAESYGLNHVSVNSHGKKHVLPKEKAVEDAVQQSVTEAIIERVATYRDEVNLPLPEKSKYIENRLWADYLQIEKPIDRMVVIREIVKQQQEQAKLTGAYVKDGDNPKDISHVVNIVKKFYDDIISYSRENNLPLPGDDYIAGEVRRLCEPNNVDADVVMKQVKLVSGMVS